MDRRHRIMIALAAAADGEHKSVARALRDAGVEIIHVGENQTPEGIAWAALQEDVDAVVVWLDSAWRGDEIAASRKALDDAGFVDAPLFVVATTKPDWECEGKVEWLAGRDPAMDLAARITSRLEIHGGKSTD